MAEIRKTLHKFRRLAQDRSDGRKLVCAYDTQIAKSDGGSSSCGRFQNSQRIYDDNSRGKYNEKKKDECKMKMLLISV